jgi:hypothetical protein
MKPSLESARLARGFYCLLIFAVVTTSAGCVAAARGLTQKIPIASEPSGALVIVDGKNVGETPIRVDLARCDTHSIRIEKPGYIPYETTTATTQNDWTLVYVVPALVMAPAVLLMLVDPGVFEIIPDEVSARLLVASPAGTQATSSNSTPASP